MTENKKIKPISKNTVYCQRCGMLPSNCLCKRLQPFTSPVNFWLLTTEKESFRPSNTGRLLSLVMPEATRSFIWQRTKAPVELIKLIQSEAYDIFLLFPEINQSMDVSRVKLSASTKKKAFILIDGTWKEAEKMLRLSPYLSKLQKVSFDHQVTSAYNFRRGATDQQLCTYEAAIEVLHGLGEVALAQKGKAIFDLYQKAFTATIHGHPMKE